jgi:ABC-type multidrug transport system fused ATPase/permease subunit
VVAHTRDITPDLYWSIAGCWRRLCCCAVHLYTLLTAVLVQNQDRYKTILVIVTGLLVIAMIFKISWLITVAMLIGIVSAFIPVAAKGIEWFWLKLAMGLGWVNSRILLSLVYFLFLLPIAWLSRFFTKDPLTLRNRKTSSLFSDRNHLYTKKDLENIW